jgi:TRAP-type C4-dicarboxylate transport system substrate-binding protein
MATRSVRRQPRLLFAWMLALATGLSAPGVASAQDKPINLRISLWVPASHPLVAAARDWAASMQTESGGSITATVFPSEQLGKAFDHYDMARSGIADVTYVSPGYQPGRFPIIDAAQLPFVAAKEQGGTRAVDEWYSKYAPAEMADTHFCMAFLQEPGSLHSRTKIVVPSDVRGKKVRPAQSITGQWVTLLGGTNVQASAPEARDALDRGVADAIFFPWNSMFLFGLDRATKFSIATPLYTVVYTWTMNKATYDNASAAQKKVIDDHCTPDWAERLAGPWAEFEHQGLARLTKESGHTMVELTPDQLELWKQSAAPIEATWADQVRKQGLDPAAVLQDLRDKLAAQKAGF